MKKITTLLFICLIATTAHAQLSSGLVAWWPFNGNAKDGTGKGHDGTGTAITYGAGKTGIANTAAVFNGTSSYLRVASQPDINLNKFSICAVLKLNGFYTGLCQVNTILTRGHNANSGFYTFEISDNLIDSSCTNLDTNKYEFNIGCSNNPIFHAAQHNASNYVHTGSWICVTATYDSIAYRLYINGVLRHTFYPQNPPVPMGTSTDSIGIGAMRYGDYNLYPYWFNGLMDDLRLYNRALPATDIDNYCANYHNIHPESVETVPSLQFITAYPNPSNGNFTISGYTGNSKHVLVEISNTLGQVIYREEVTPVNNELNKTIALSASVADGMYYINLSTNEEHKSLKVLINR